MRYNYIKALACQALYKNQSVNNYVSDEKERKGQIGKTKLHRQTKGLA